MEQVEPLMPPVIDFHAHMPEKEVLAQARGKTVLTGFGTRQPPIVEGPQRTAMFEKMLAPKVQVADMDRRGVDMHVISSSTVIQGTSWADAKTEFDLVRRINDCAAAWCAAYPKRFAGSFVLPLQDVELSLREMELNVANLSASYAGHYLGHARFHPFWEVVLRGTATVVIYPLALHDARF